MSLTTERVQGKQCTLTVGSALSNWTKYTFEHKIESREARAASAGKQQRVVLYEDATLTVEGYRGGDEAFADLVAVGDVVTSISGTDLPTDIVTKFGPWRVKSKKMEQGEDPGTYTLELECGYVDVTPTP